jgi:hypothetical protein
MAFSRQHLKDVLIGKYHPMNIIWHPIMFEDEAAEANFSEPWIQPIILPGNAPAPDFVIVGIQKLNYFIQNASIIDEDYYCIPSDDDMYEDGVFDEVKTIDEDVVVISLKRGHQIPPNTPLTRQYPSDTLLAHPDNMIIGLISGEQYFMKGRIFRALPYLRNSQSEDGTIAEYLKANYNIHYRPDLFALFNYYEPGRWNKS